MKLYKLTQDVDWNWLKAKKGDFLLISPSYHPDKHVGGLQLIGDLFWPSGAINKHIYSFEELKILIQMQELKIKIQHENFIGIMDRLGIKRLAA